VRCLFVATVEPSVLRNDSRLRFAVAKAKAEKDAEWQQKLDCLIAEMETRVEHAAQAGEDKAMNEAAIPPLSLLRLTGERADAARIIAYALTPNWLVEQIAGGIEVCSPSVIVRVVPELAGTMCCFSCLGWFHCLDDD
jgi:hypothetical protein